MKKQVLAIAFISLSVLFPVSASAQTINGLTVFGDSLSDNGNLFRVTGNQIPPSPPYFQGRFSNGPVWVENLGADARFSTTTANFAFGGATTGTLNVFNLQFPQLPTLPGLQTEINLALQASPRLSPDRLYTVWAGANDYFGGMQTNTAIPVSNITNAITTLSNAGAQTILVVNLPDLGKLPLSLANPNPAVAANFTQIANSHNENLRASLQNLSQNNSNLNIIPLDLFALFNDAIANPGLYGFTNVTQSCLTRTSATTFNICSNPDQFIFWDELHPTAATHRIISQYALAVLSGPQTIAPQGDIALNVARRQTRDIQGRLVTLATTPLNPRDRWGVFLGGDINFGEQNNTANQTGFNFTTGGFTVGVDNRIANNLALGFALSYGGNESNLNNNRGRINVDSYAATIYSNFSQNQFYADALLSYGWNNFGISRNTGFLNRTATANTNGNQFSARLSSGYNFVSKDFSIGPTAGIRYDRVNIYGYTENNATLFNMRVRDQQAESFVLNLGAIASYAFKTNGGSITPYLGANYEHEFANNSRQVITELVTQPGIPFRINTGNPARDYVRLSAGVQAQFSQNLSGVIGYETIVGRDNFSDNFINGQIRYQF